ncbi:ABC transporter ATP-binding protein [bacterium SCSIO 12827]|nr:ABC transporter ATP-binding protein [bacterium SCSIO 12827]
MRGYARWFFAALACMALMAAATAASAWLMEPVVNDIFVNRDESMLMPVGLAVFAVFIIKGLANYGQATLMAYVGLRIVTDNQNRLFDKLSRMDVKFFQDSNTGGLISRFLVDINQMRGAVSNAWVSLGKDAMTLIGLIGVTFYQDWRLALIAFIIFPAALLPIVKLGRRMRKVTANTQREMGLFTTLLEQTIQGIRVVKAYSMEAYERGRVSEIVERVFNLTMKAERTRALSSPIMETLGGVAVGIVIFYGGYRVIHGNTDAGSFFSFITALLLAYEPMKRLANLNAALQQGLAGADRLFQMLDMEPAIQETPDARDLQTPVKGAVEFRNVGFAYTQDRVTLNDLSLTVPAGKTVALVGPSGAGKSTILNLIPRFYDVAEGAVLVDGEDVRGLTFASLRGAMALVSQEVTLFDDTVRANIAYGRAGASEDEIIEAARNAAAHDFIAELPDGYDTLVGEQGVKLSGGQRQRLAIARAMLKNAPILLLDEATSALDTESERQVQAALDALMTDRTTLVIAHRLSTVVRADLICVIVDGRVAEQGSHAELLARGGHYKHLYELQFAGDAPGNGPDAARQAAGR